MDDAPSGPMDEAQRVKQALSRRLLSRSAVTGEIALPAVPGLIDEYVTMCADTFASVGRKFSDDEIAHLRAVLEGQLAQAYAASPRSSIVISYKAPIGESLQYRVDPRWWTVEAAYEDWISSRQPPLFGTEPDARVWALAGEAADPATYRILDIGAGTGRNTLALARRGHPVHAVEMTPKFAELIRAEAQRESLNVRVIEGDVFSTNDGLRQDYQLIVLSEVVSDFRTTRQLRALFELAAHRLAPGATLVFNVFLPCGSYTPDEAAREFGQQAYTSIFTRHEMAAATAGLPLELVADDSVYDYEMAHLPDGAWPPTSWYPDWVCGLDVFTTEREKSPIEMRWLVFQKTR